VAATKVTTLSRSWAVIVERELKEEGEEKGGERSMRPNFLSFALLSYALSKTFSPLRIRRVLVVFIEVVDKTRFYISANPPLHPDY